MTSAAERRRRWQRGRSAEAAGVLLLRLKGYRVLARNLRTPYGEIDIVARRGAVLAAIEVKRRADAAGALAALRPRQQDRIARALLHFQATRPALAGLALRFDALAVGGLWPRHLPDAWRPEASRA